MKSWLIVRAGKKFLAANGTTLASALAYSTFFAIPSALIVATGLFSLIAAPQTITTPVNQLHGVVPDQVITLLSQSLHRADAHPGTSIVWTIFGFVVALWSVTGAMNAYMLAVNIAYGRKDRRSFLRSASSR